MGLLLIQNHLVDPSLFTELFTCDLSACRGACCVEGEGGAPLEPAECGVLERIYPDIKNHLEPAGRKALRQEGRWVEEAPGYYATPLVGGRQCAYTVFENGIAKCGIEKAWLAGQTDFQKPISCALYPIRVEEQQGRPLLYYHRWEICSPACQQGKLSGLRVYQFVRSALERKFGTDFYRELDAAAHAYLEQYSE